MPYKNDVFCIKKRMKQPFSFSLLFSLWLFKKQKNHQLPDTIDDYKIGAGEGNRTLVSALGRPHSTIEPHPPALWPGQPECSDNFYQTTERPATGLAD